MADTAARLTEEVLPKVPARQSVLSLPFEVRYRPAWDGELVSAVLALLLRVLQHVAVVEEAIEDGGGQDRVPGQHLRPLEDQLADIQIRAPRVRAVRRRPRRGGPRRSGDRHWPLIRPALIGVGASSRFDEGHRVYFSRGR